MRRELQEKLFKKYPKIFKQKDDDMTQTCMCWGIECGDGWFWLLDMLCSAIQSHCDSYSNGSSPRQVEAIQVKEKFGGLRFYIGGGDDEIDGMIGLAEHMSYTICEVCGSQDGKANNAGWIKVRCPNCKDK